MRSTWNKSFSASAHRGDLHRATQDLPELPGDGRSFCLPYGLVQAALCLFERLAGILKMLRVEFEQSHADLCVFKKVVDREAVAAVV